MAKTTVISANDQIQQGREVNYTADSPVIEHNSPVCSRGVFSLKHTDSGSPEKKDLQPTSHEPSELF